MHPHITVFIERKRNGSEEDEVLEEFGEVLEIEIQQGKKWEPGIDPDNVAPQFLSQILKQKHKEREPGILNHKRIANHIK